MSQSSQWCPGLSWFVSPVPAAQLSAYYLQSADGTSGLSQVIFPIRMSYVHLALLSTYSVDTHTFQLKLWQPRHLSSHYCA